MGRRFVVPILIGCSLLVSVGMVAGIWQMRYRENLYLQDMEGDRAALASYTVTGVLDDFSHEIGFSLKRGEWQTDFSPDTENLRNEEPEEWQVGLQEGNWYFQLDDYAWADILPLEGTEIQATAGKPDTREELAQVQKEYAYPDNIWTNGDDFTSGSVTFWNGQYVMRQEVYFSEKPGSTINPTFTQDKQGNILGEVEGYACRGLCIPLSLNCSGKITMEWMPADEAESGYIHYQGSSSLHDGFWMADDAVIGDRLYLTFPTDIQDSGTMGIYAFDLQEVYDSGNPYVTKMVTEPCLVFGESAVDHRHQVLGLERVGDKLLLLKRAENQGIVELYDTEGNLLDKEEISFARPFTGVEAEVSAWEDGASLILSWSGQSDTYGSNAMEHYGFTVDAAGQMTHQFLKVGYPWIQAVPGKGSVLTVEEPMIQTPETAVFFPNGGPQPQQTFLTVYDETMTKILYRGEIVTDENDDLKGIYGAFSTKEAGRKRNVMAADTWDYMLHRRYWQDLKITYEGETT